MPTLTLYHGTAHAFDDFAEPTAVGVAEPNSALGIHLSESPYQAAEYAEMSARQDAGAGEATVLVCEVDLEKISIVDRLEDFFGYDPDTEAPLNDERREEVASSFAAAREILLSEGVGAVVAEEMRDDVTGTFVILDPSAIKIFERLSAEDVFDMNLDRHADISDLNRADSFTLETGRHLPSPA